MNVRSISRNKVIGGEGSRGGSAAGGVDLLALNKPAAGSLAFTQSRRGVEIVLVPAGGVRFRGTAFSPWILDRGEEYPRIPLGLRPPL